ncbi:MAG: MBL fold metallo-hydrolase [Deltaproteobacteria bacterium]|nr:MBL fold metallo-hydrolase [Deltaproteobacteria bacterium]
MMKTLIVGPLEVNCYILWDKKSREAVVIDPGGDVGAIINTVKKEGLKVKYIVNTHGHFDHVGGNAEVKASTGAQVAIHGNDATLMKESHEHGILFGVNTPEQGDPEILLKDGDVIKTGEIKMRVIHTPGHTKGGICLFDKKKGRVFTGDTLFAGSIGRTDFPGGSYDEIIDSIKKKLIPLGGFVRVFPGHGPETTITDERERNPFIAGD